MILPVGNVFISNSVQVLNVAEKNDAAKNIAELLSRGNTTNNIA